MTHASPIEPAKIDMVTKQLQADDQRNNQKLGAAYRAMTNSSQAREPSQIAVKQHDIERTI